MYTVVVSAGHSPVGDPGAVGKRGERECDLVLPYRDSLMKHLREDPECRVVSVSDDKTLRETIRFARVLPHDLALELHFNIFDRPEANGVECFYSAQQPKMLALAQAIVLGIARRFGQTNRGAKPDNRSAHRSLGFLREIPNSILIEIAFMSNPQDMARVADADAWGKELAGILLAHLRKTRGKT